jgi:adenosylmethionine-8-amino-7-oxononanoate aminotransferase
MARRLHPVAALDHAHVWHPFTQMRDWLRAEPIVLTHGRGATLRDVQGRRYLDANSSIWTNLHGHRHPRLDAALRRQLGKVAHTSSLGLAGEPAARLAAELVDAAVPPAPTPDSNTAPNPTLTKVFFSDDGSTAIETALKLAYEFTRRTHGPKPAPRFLSIDGAYHGDTVGAVSVGHIDLFHKAYGGLLFRADRVASPYCYRCPFNKAAPERADARSYRKCHWECVDGVASQFERAQRTKRPYSAFVYEPRMQGAAGMIAQPDGWLPRVATIARAHGSLLIADEVMTGFGRTGGASLFAGHAEGVVPDLMALAKGLTGGYLPLAATLATQPIFDAFLGEYAEFRTFFHGHSYTGNALGCAVARESLALLRPARSQRTREALARQLTEGLATLWQRPSVGDIRQIGLVAGIELVQDWQRRTPFPLAARAGIRVCEAMTRRGVLTRSIGNVVVLMPPYCTRPDELRRMVSALHDSIEEIHG